MTDDPALSGVERAGPGVRSLTRRRLLQASVAATAVSAVGAATGLFTETAAASDDRTSGSAKPNVVLVHGAFADGSSWNGVIEKLSERGYPVFAVPVTLTSIAKDVTIVQNFFASQGVQGPTILVGHSYGGAVIGGIGSSLPNVKALVFVAALGLDVGESIAAVLGQFPPAPGFQYVTLPPDAQNQVWLNRENFRFAFAADVSRRTALAMAATQRSIDIVAFLEPATAAAWHSIPSWYQISGQDNIIPPAAEQFMASRMNAHTITLASSSHASMVSHPHAIAELIVRADRATS